MSLHVQYIKKKRLKSCFPSSLMMTSYKTLVGYELQNVPKFNSQIKEPSSNSKLMSLHEQFYTKMIELKIAFLSNLRLACYEILVGYETVTHS